MSAAEQKVACVNRFIDLANEINKEGIGSEVVSSSIMTACALYATFVVTGNAGALRESGVEKITNLFSEELAQVQRAKIERAEREGREVPEQS